jgi:hypothetical protein
MKLYMTIFLLTISTPGFCAVRNLLSHVSEFSSLRPMSKRLLSNPSQPFIPDGGIPAADRKTVRILSIDGGGIRAVVPLYTLRRIEQDTGKPIVQLFDVIAGTSSGGLTALALNVSKEHREELSRNQASLVDPQNNNENNLTLTHSGVGPAAYSANDLLRLYENHANLVFNGKVKYSENSSVLRLLFNKTNYKPRHSIEGLRHTLTNYFGDLKLSQTLSTVLTTAYEIQRGQSHVFNSYNAKPRPQQSSLPPKYDASQDFLMRDVALSTAAAPTYFSPVEINDLVSPPGISEKYHFVDGGVVSNNPTLRAFIQAKNLFPGANDFFIVSLGTGIPTRLYINYEGVRNSGVIGWAPLITPMLMHATSESTLKQVEEVIDYEFRRTPEAQLRWQTDPRYHRLDIALTDELLPLDKIDKTHIDQLKIGGAAVVSKNIAHINRIVKELMVPRKYVTGLEGHVLMPGEDLR